VNIGKWQVLYWPRKHLAFWRGPSFMPHIYRFVVYVWPIEVRRFK